MKLIVTVLFILTACGSDVAGPEVDAAPVVELDAAVDALAGLAHGASCDPVGSQCQDGLTCRVLGDHDGVCLPVGNLVEGDICPTSSQCGAAMMCLPAELGRWRCSIVCSTIPTTGDIRCADTQHCQRYWSDDLGFCQ